MLAAPVSIKVQKRLDQEWIGNEQFSQKKIWAWNKQDLKILSTFMYKIVKLVKNSFNLSGLRQFKKQ